MHIPDFIGVCAVCSHVCVHVLVCSVCACVCTHAHTRVCVPLFNGMCRKVPLGMVTVAHRYYSLVSLYQCNCYVPSLNYIKARMLSLYKVHDW